MLKSLKISDSEVFKHKLHWRIAVVIVQQENGWNLFADKTLLVEREYTFLLLYLIACHFVFVVMYKVGYICI